MKVFSIVIVLLILLVWLYCLTPYNVWDEYYYFDNNGTTMIHSKVLREIRRNSYLGNPSASYAVEARKRIAKTQSIIRSWVNSDYDVYFTSGGSESINTIINSIADSASQPHIITSVAEHTTTLECCKNLEILNRAKVTYVSSDPFIKAEEVVEAMTPNTVLVTLIHGNNETGVLNDVREICRRVKAVKPDVIFHIDAVQSFGKFSIPLKKWGIDALSFSGHKFNAGSGIGGLVVASNMHLHYPLICGSQQNGVRGGTENVAAIAGLGMGIQIMAQNRHAKNMSMWNKTTYIWEYLQNNVPRGYAVHLITPLYETNKMRGNKCLPNTLMLYITSTVKPVCNVKIKKELQNKGYIISIGSACKTGSKYASHVVYALSISEEARKGILRISVGDFNTKYECMLLARAIISTMHI